MDMAKDLKHLQRKYRTYYARVAIPPSLRQAFGSKRTCLIRSLETTSLSEAQRKRHKVVDELKALIDAAKTKTVAGQGVTFDVGLAAEAMAFSKRIEKAFNAGEDDRAAAISVELIERSQEVEVKRGKTAGDTLWQAGNGATPLRLHFETWMNEKSFGARTKGDHRAALRKLEIWMEAKGLTLVVNEVTNRIAGEFKIEEFSKKNAHPKTANKQLSSLRTIGSGWPIMVTLKKVILGLGCHCPNCNHFLMSWSAPSRMMKSQNSSMGTLTA